MAKKEASKKLSFVEFILKSILVKIVALILTFIPIEWFSKALANFFAIPENQSLYFFFYFSLTLIIVFFSLIYALYQKYLREEEIKSIISDEAEDILKNKLKSLFGFERNLFEIEQKVDKQNEHIVKTHWEITTAGELEEIPTLDNSQNNLRQIYFKNHRIDPSKIKIIERSRSDGEKIDDIKEIRGQPGRWIIPVSFTPAIEKIGTKASFTIEEHILHNIYPTNKREAELISETSDEFYPLMKEGSDYLTAFILFPTKELNLKVTLPPNSEIQPPKATGKKHYTVFPINGKPQPFQKDNNIKFTQSKSEGSNTTNTFRLNVKKPKLLHTYMLIWQFLK